MHSHDIFENAHLALIATANIITEEQAHIPNVCGEWSIKDIMIHLISFEQVLVDLLASLQGEADTQLLHDFIYDPTFNDRVVAEDQSERFSNVLDKYVQVHEKAKALLTTLPESLNTTSGILGWYGQDYDLDDFIVYTYYGHKTEHMAQIQMSLEPK